MSKRILPPKKCNLKNVLWGRHNMMPEVSRLCPHPTSQAEKASAVVWAMGSTSEGGPYFSPVETQIPQHITKPLLTTEPAPASNQHVSYESQCMESMLARYLGMHHLRGCCTVLYVGGGREAPPLLRLQAVRNQDTRLFYLFKNHEWNPIHLCCEIKTLTHSTLRFMCLVMKRVTLHMNNWPLKYRILPPTT